MSSIKPSPSTINIECKPCTFCEKVTWMKIDLTSFNRWREGMHIQSAFPDMPAPERELLISGTCPECWAKFMKDDD